MKQFLRTSGAQDPWFPKIEGQQAYRWLYEALCSFSPHPGDEMISWFAPKPVYCYYDLLAVYNTAFPGYQSWPGAYTAPNSSANPNFILHDVSGNPLYINWGCANGICPQFVGDLSNPVFGDWQIAQLKSIQAKGYAGVWLDDVDLDINSVNGSGTQVLLPGVTPYTWARRLVELLERIKTALPGFQIIHNSVWSSSAPQELINRQIVAADRINIEGGFGWLNNDPVKNMQMGEFISRCHKLGRPVIIEDQDSSHLATSVALFNQYCDPSNDWFSARDVTVDKWPTL